MKRILLLPALIVSLALVITSCGKEYIEAPTDEGYWLSQERGVVVYNDYGCDYYIVETNRGYTVIEGSSSLPYIGDVLYGNFSSWGYRSIYNRSAGYIITGNIQEYWLTYAAARDEVYYSCGRKTDKSPTATAPATAAPKAQ